MPDLDDRFRSFARVRAPDLWLEIEHREPAPPHGPPASKRILAGAVAILIAVAGFAVAGRALSGGVSTHPGASPSVSQLESMHGRAFGGASASGALWVTTCTDCPADLPSRKGELVRIDPTSGQVVNVLPIRSPGDVAATAGAAWVLDFTGGSVSRVDAASGLVTSTTSLNLPSGREMPDGSFLPLNVTVGEGSVWVSTARGALAKLDPTTNAVRDIIPLPAETTGDVAAGAGGVWVTEDLLGLFRVDPQTDGVVDRIRITRGEEVFSPSEVAVVGSHVLAQGVWSKPTSNGDYQTTGNTALVEIDPSTDAVTSTIDTGYVRLVAGDGGLWIDTRASAQEVKLSSSGLALSARTNLPGPLLAVAAGQLWSQDSSGTVVPIEQHSSGSTGSGPVATATVQVSNFPSEVPNAPAAGFGSVWTGVQVEGRADFVVRVDTTDNKLVARIPVDEHPWEIAAGAGAIWVTGYEGRGGVVQRIDPSTNQVVATIPVDPAGDTGPLAAGADGTWVAVGNTGSNDIVRIDPSTNAVSERVTVPSPQDAYVNTMEISGDDLWVSLSRGGGLVRFDARTGAVVAQIAVEARSLLATSSSVWVSDRKTPNSDSFVLQRLSTSTNSVVGTPISLPSGYGPIAIDEGGVWLDGYDPQEQVSLIHVDGNTGQIDAQSKPIDSYYTGGTYDPVTNSVWVTAPLGSLTRFDL